MYLFFDTETTGIPDYNKDLLDPVQPQILQLALLLADENGREMMSWKGPITPPMGFEIDERLVGDNGKPTAYSVNKLGNVAVKRYGVSMKAALGMFRLFESKAGLKIAHNYRFDGFLVKAAHAKENIEPINPPLDKFCTMKIAFDLKKDGVIESGSLNSFYRHVTGKDIDNAHDALADVRACKDVFFWIIEKGLYKPQPRYIPEKAA